MKILFLVDIANSYSLYVLAEDPTTAEKLIHKKYEEWGLSYPFIINIKKVAMEGRYSAIQTIIIK